MSEITPLEVTLELPATEYVDHESGPLVRCPLNGKWVSMSDYYSEKPGQMLPLVGRASYEEVPEHWVDTGERDAQDQPIMAKAPKEDPVVWNEVVRILEAPPYVAPKGGVIEMNVSDSVGTSDNMGG